MGQVLNHDEMAMRQWQLIAHAQLTEWNYQVLMYDAIRC